MARARRLKNATWQGLLWRMGFTDAPAESPPDSQTASQTAVVDPPPAPAPSPTETVRKTGSGDGAAGERLSARCVSVLERYPVWRGKIYRLQFYPYAGLKSTIRERRHDVTIRISDLLAEAPREVLEGIVDILLARFWKREPDPQTAEAYEAFAAQPGVMESASQAHRDRGRGAVVTGTSGRHHDLQPLYDRINRDYFQGRIQATVSWSVRRMRRMLGYYKHAHRLVVVSRNLDARAVPKYVVAYILYHEMLHAADASTPTGERKRRRVHDAAFLQKERQYHEYARAIRWLKRRGWK